MFDAWVAECVPCKWEAAFPNQDAAIAAAEEHVYSTHPRTTGHARAEARIACVQQRTILTADEQQAAYLTNLQLTTGEIPIPPAVTDESFAHAAIAQAMGEQHTENTSTEG